ncbi:hypothetical protein AMATHDRAFT_8016 [Amanita thiersii Skay4041]|uniref:Protein kinase domain-containing protein n=1 Tax=Amanita thiersii Skay4041 TaxID=703135 RepID=A0A2A9N7D0_9AGAR|nr:hypothetical protein AMATHDRAFT_8016 [Amanita thiersii Skay4041]
MGDMANTTSGPSLTNNSTNKSARYSTLKVLQFMSKDKNQRPPPPPPKDPCYTNRSHTSLSPDTLSLPPQSPMSPYYHHHQHHQFSNRTSPDPTQSSVSLLSSAASAKSSAVDTTQSQTSQRQSRLKAKASSLFTFVKRNKSLTRKNKNADRPPSPPSDDAGISMPWNFQHNIHVDEGFVGLPPSWTTQLVSAGATKEEIAAAIQARRMAALSQGQQQLYEGRPQTPNLPLFNIAPGQSPSSPILTHPSQRTTSLPRRQPSDASLNSFNSRPKSPSLPLIASRNLTSPSSASLHSNRTTTTNSSRNPASQNHHTQQSSIHHEAAPSISLSLVSQSEAIDGQGTDQIHPESFHASSPLDEHPSTPPRRPYHVVNASPYLTSPPPAYSQSGISYVPDRKATLDLEDGPLPADSTDATPSHRTHKSSESNGKTFNPAGRRASIIRNKRNSVLPPRLSLHKTTDSLDLSSWSADVLSGISSSGFSSSPGFALEQSKKTSSTGITTPHSQPSSSKSLPDPLRPSTNLERKVSDPQERRPTKYPPPSLSVPPIMLQGEDSDDSRQEGDDSPAPPSGWAEPASAVRRSPSSPLHHELSPHLSPPLPDVDSPVDKSINMSGGRPVVREEINPEYVLPLKVKGENKLLPKVPDQITKRRLNQVKSFEGPEDDPDESFLHVENKRDSSNRYSSQSRASTVSTTSTATITGYMDKVSVVRNASVVRRMVPRVLDNSDLAMGLAQKGGMNHELAISRLPPLGVNHVKHPSSPLSSHFESEEGSASGSVSSSSPSQDHATPTTDTDSPLKYYMGSAITPSPSKMNFSITPTRPPLEARIPTTGTFGVPRDYIDENEAEDAEPLDSGGTTGGTMQRPTIVIHTSDKLTSPLSNTIATPIGGTPLTPQLRYRGWLSEVVKPLEQFIDEAVEPRDHYINLQEIAEGDSGSVFAAQLANKDLRKLRLPEKLKAQDRETLDRGEPVAVAIKSIAILPSGSPKLLDLERELKLMRGLSHEHVLGMDALYVDLVEDSLWIRMELMERSLADVVSLAEHGLKLPDRVIAGFAKDVLQALQFIQQHHIAHRDVRSDNLLINIHGVLKLADFSAAVQVSPSSPMRSDVVGVAYWQAPEIRSPPYNALKVDIWSLGATIWELAESEPPFASTQQLADQWPTLSKPKMFSSAFHDFLRRCSEPAATRPSAQELCKHPYMNNACGRSVIQQVLAHCMTIEKQIQDEMES